MATLAQIDTTEARLREWARFCRDFSGIGPRYPSCGSIESFWRSPQVWHEVLPRPEAPNEYRAYEVEVWVRELPRKQPTILRIEYVLTNRRDGETPEQFENRKRRSALCSEDEWREELGLGLRAICDLIHAKRPSVPCNSVDMC